jgi:hypothetical protein|tara:strand:- start:287 stop:496 length:210 start_codon:yes stop_codon:yes gene_type:complete
MNKLEKINIRVDYLEGYGSDKTYSFYTLRDLVEWEDDETIQMLHLLKVGESTIISGVTEKVRYTRLEDK